MEGLQICVWPGYDWCRKTDISAYKHLGDDYMELTVPSFVDENKIDVWLEATKPQDHVVKLKQFMVAVCPKCGELEFPTRERKPAVQCAVCGKYHLSDSNDYIAVSGNVTIGMNHGLIGNNLTDGDVVKHVSVFCLECFKIACDSNQKKSEDIEEKTEEKPKEKTNITCYYNNNLYLDYASCKYHSECMHNYPVTYEICREGK